MSHNCCIKVTLSLLKIIYTGYILYHTSSNMNILKYEVLEFATAQPTWWSHLEELAQK
jgi:hypothetical protein